MDDLEGNKALIRTYWDAVNNEDYATLASIHDPTARNHAPAAFDVTEWPPEGKPFGPVEVRDTVASGVSGLPISRPGGACARAPASRGARIHTGCAVVSAPHRGPGLQVVLHGRIRQAEAVGGRQVTASRLDGADYSLRRPLRRPSAARWDQGAADGRRAS